MGSTDDDDMSAFSRRGFHYPVEAEIGLIVEQRASFVLPFGGIARFFVKLFRRITGKHHH